jgi:hypothetical protein
MPWKSKMDRYRPAVRAIGCPGLLSRAASMKKQAGFIKKFRLSGGGDIMPGWGWG